MWDKDKVEIHALAEHVWGKEGEKVTDATIRATISKANTELLKIGIPWTLSYRRGYCAKDR
jgi:hypothetical protein